MRAGGRKSTCTPSATSTSVWRIHVENSRSKRIDNNQSESIGHNKNIEVGNNHHEVIGGNMMLMVGPNMLQKGVTAVPSAPRLLLAAFGAPSSNPTNTR